MRSEFSANLSREQVSRIETHLREQYLGVFDEQMITAHLSEYVESNFADSLAAVIAAGGKGGATLLDIGSGYGAFVLACRRQEIDATGLELASSKSISPGNACVAPSLAPMRMPIFAVATVAGFRLRTGLLLS